jgi:hypothetical protein
LADYPALELRFRPAPDLSLLHELLYAALDDFQQPPEGWPPVVHLSIKRKDKRPIHDWRDLQEIKNQLVGRECEGVEIYPAESRLVDGANQFHLWVFNNPQAIFPIGFFGDRDVIERSPSGGKQRPFAK